MQACTIAHTEDRDTQVGLIVCMMSSPNPSTAGPDCFQEMGLDYQPILVSVSVEQDNIGTGISPSDD